MARWAAFVVVLALVVPAPARSGGASDHTRDVDPFIGTLGSGFVFPGPAAAYGMVQLSPDTEGYLSYTGYMRIDHFIRGFSHVHTESMGVPEGGQVPFMPTTGPIVTDVMSYESLFLHATEQAAPGYYRVTLARDNIDVELTAGLRSGLQRYTFPAGAAANVLIDAGREIPGNDTEGLERTPGSIPASVHVTGDRSVAGVAHGADYTVYFATRFDRPFASSAVWAARGDAAVPGTAVTGSGAGMALTFDASRQQVVASTGISFVSESNALENLDADLAGGATFDDVRSRTRGEWRDALSVIDVTGGDPVDRRAFYTALYHAQHHPNIFNDVNGDYIGYDGATHRVGDAGGAMPSGSAYYANFSMWDTYRAEMPLLMLIAPDRVKDMMRSLAAIAIQGGRVPRWGWMNGYADFMNGEPAAQVFADAYCRGLTDPATTATLYDNLKALTLDPSRHRDPQFLQLGWVPFPGSGASSTLEHALGDFALALVAHDRADTTTRDALLNASGNWRNHLDPDTLHLRPRLADGTWAGDPYLPEMPDGWREGTGWQYDWLVPHDVAGLLDGMGRDVASQRLDEFFAAALAAPVAGPEIQQKLSLYGIAYYGNQYAPSNEHDLQAPWLYDWIGEPAKEQILQRSLQSIYRATPDGLPGNDDLGTMSAWFVWSALGFYPVTPGSPTYAIGSPLFERAVIKTSAGDTVVSAHGASAAAKFIGGAELNGAPLDRVWFTHDDLLGGTVTFHMSSVPSAWGAGPGAAPPSASASSLTDFACSP